MGHASQTRDAHRAFWSVLNSHNIAITAPLRGCDRLRPCTFTQERNRWGRCGFLDSLGFSIFKEPEID